MTGNPPQISWSCDLWAKQSCTEYEDILTLNSSGHSLVWVLAFRPEFSLYQTRWIVEDTDSGSDNCITGKKNQKQKHERWAMRCRDKALHGTKSFSVAVVTAFAPKCSCAGILIPKITFNCVWKVGFFFFLQETGLWGLYTSGGLIYSWINGWQREQSCIKAISI